MPNTIAYNSPLSRDMPFPYGVLAAGQSRFTPQDPAVTARFKEHTVILTLDGVGEVTVRDQVNRPGPLTLSWVNTSAEYRHACAPESDAWTYLWFSFAGHALGQLYDKLARRGQLHAAVGPDTIDTFKAVLRAVSSSHPGRHSQLSALVAQVIARFENSPSQRASQSTLHHLAIAISENLAEPWDTQTMAAQAGLSQSRFHAVFREAFDLPPATWLREQRINAAKRMLTETALPMTRIGELCGYPDPHHFSREFAKNALLPPSRFRAQMRSRVAR
ncbi:helix-turn-helix domain-containing protein [Thalassorhabdomicrobium marinisediminis]|uniref:helix-turn-helix domain-containing protein n=1 Tax=Thalassorhabdomicrobium marinisediminis TaxID=2170577 RepID=UPI00249050CA|nr:AraC family transcriptional regulator [Thalassorhabdomicrobium marinisediminis]